MKKIITYIFILILAAVFVSCGDDDSSSEVGGGEDVAYSPERDEEIQRYNLEQARILSVERSPCDTLSLVEYVIDNYPAGTYLVDFDKTFTLNIPKPAVYYYSSGENYIFGIIVKSGADHRLVEAKNVVGYDQSFIDLDSTELGTAFFYLVLFKCKDEQLSVVWEAPIPNHGGFNRFFMETWIVNKTTYIRCNFHDARGIGHIDYNYFFINGIEQQPHFLMTYEGINYKRTIGNVNKDKYPDYYEYLYYDLGDRVYVADSIAFVWDIKDSVYVNTRNRRQTRPY
ncbi:MAG: hypothetical protein R6W90_12570 [Ignavibacteriaceae bacterium]